MIAGEGSGAPREVVQARRLEIVDDEGRVRAVLGMTETSGSEPVECSFRDPSGQEIVLIRLDDDGASLSLSFRGDVVVHLGVHGPGSDAHGVRSFLHLAGDGGIAGVGWRVSPTGGVDEVRGSSADDPPDDRGES